MNTLIIINEPPYGNERSYNGLRLAKALIAADASVTVFLIADGVSCANTTRKCQKVFIASS
jgi:uncharacterized protein involved in oxidation of intracellular sulfur